MVINSQSAIKIFYYLMAIDDEISAEEIDTLNAIGLELDAENFPLYKDTVFSECNRKSAAATGKDRYFVLAEYADNAFAEPVDSQVPGIPARLLIWNMLVMAYANGVYADEELHLIHHIARLSKTENSVISEMEEYIRTIRDIDTLLEHLESSSLPYAQIQPLVHEWNSRKSVIMKAVTALISDEITDSVEAIEIKDDFIDKAKSFIADSSTPAIDSTKKAFGKAMSGLKARLQSMNIAGKDKTEE